MRAIRAIVIAGIAGNLAISAYLSVALPAFFHTPPILLFQWDASNIVGSGAYRGGWSSAALGFFFDFVVSWLWAAVFVVLYRAISPSHRSPVVWGLCFGFAVMLVMGYVVVPLGHAIRPSDDAAGVLNRLVAHTVFFGLPLASVVRHTYSLQ